MQDCRAAVCTGTSYGVALCLAIWLLGVSAMPAVGLTIALDVGHSLAHPGATSARGVPEFVFNQALAGVVQDALIKHGFRVRMIGAQGDMHDLKARTHAAVGTDFFLSLHHDSVQPQYLEDWVHASMPRRFSDRFAGFSLFVSRANPHLALSLACASQLGAALRHAGFEPSPHHAEPIPGENRPFADKTNGVHYFDNLVVLKTATQAALLLEAGVIVHRVEELTVQQPARREAMATAIAAALEVCLRRQPLAAPAPGEAR
jgi:N-acetylmuramoyl-L-alanine amidase